MKFVFEIDDPDLASKVADLCAGRIPALTDEPYALNPSQTIRECYFTVRTQNILISGGIETVAQLTELTRRQLLALPNMGKKSTQEVENYLKRHGLLIRP